MDDNNETPSEEDAVDIGYFNSCKLEFIDWLKSRASRSNNANTKLERISELLTDFLQEDTRNRYFFSDLPTLLRIMGTKVSPNTFLPGSTCTRPFHIR